MNEVLAQYIERLRKLNLLLLILEVLLYNLFTLARGKIGSLWDFRGNSSALLLSLRWVSFVV